MQNWTVELSYRGAATWCETVAAASRADAIATARAHAAACGWPAAPRRAMARPA